MEKIQQALDALVDYPTLFTFSPSLRYNHTDGLVSVFISGANLEEVKTFCERNPGNWKRVGRSGRQSFNFDYVGELSGVPIMFFQVESGMHQETVNEPLTFE